MYSTHVRRERRSVPVFIKSKPGLEYRGQNLRNGAF